MRDVYRQYKISYCCYPLSSPPFSFSFSLSLNIRWFISQITKREDAEKQLLLNPLSGYGSFLIRESENNFGGYVLSVRDRDQVKHYKIKESDNQEFFIAEHRMFNSLQALVTHYQLQADGLCVNLRNPCTLESLDEWEIDRSAI